MTVLLWALQDFVQVLDLSHLDWKLNYFVLDFLFVFYSWKESEGLVQFSCLDYPEAQRGEDSWSALISGQAETCVRNGLTQCQCQAPGLWSQSLWLKSWFQQEQKRK